MLQKEPRILLNEGITVNRRVKQLFDPRHVKKVERKAEEVMALQTKMKRNLDSFSIAEKLRGQSGLPSLVV